MRLIHLLVLMLLLPTLGFTQTVYVDAELGSDVTGVGSDNFPWQTLPYTLEQVQDFVGPVTVKLRNGPFNLGNDVSETYVWGGGGRPILTIEAESGYEYITGIDEDDNVSLTQSPPSDIWSGDWPDNDEAYNYDWLATALPGGDEIPHNRDWYLTTWGNFGEFLGAGANSTMQC